MHRLAHRSIHITTACCLFAAGAESSNAQDGTNPRPGTVQLRSLTIESEDGREFAAERGTLVVPERRDVLGGKSIRLAFLRVRGNAPEGALPIVFLAGGPGSSGVEGVRDIVARAPWPLELGDVIGFDQRGTGSSEPRQTTDVDWQAPSGVPGSEAAWQASLRTVVQKLGAACRQRGIDPAAYNTVQSAHDVDDLRRALGYEKIVIQGGSYGSHLGCAVLRLHGDHIERAVLTAPEGPDHTLKLPSEVQATLERLAARVHGDPALRAEVPDLIGMLEQVLDRLENEPVEVEVGGEAMRLGRFEVQVLLSGLLGKSRSATIIPSVVAAMHEGDFALVARQAQRLRRMSAIDAMPIFTDLASGCSPERRRQIEREAEWCVLGDAINFPLQSMMGSDHALDLGPSFRGPLRSEVPVLLIAADLDCRTPIRNARELLVNLPNGRLLVVENRGHDLPWGAQGVRKQIAAFIRGEPLTASRITLEPRPIRR